MTRRTLPAMLALAALFALSPAQPATAATPAPAWALTLTSLPSNFPSGGSGQYLALATEVGAGATQAASPSQLRLTLPAGIAPTGYEAENNDPSAATEPSCEIEGQDVLCHTSEPLDPGFRLRLVVSASVSAPEGELIATATVSGGGAAQQAAAAAPTAIQAAPVPFDLLPGFVAPLNASDGAPATLAASHPYQQTIDFGFPTKNPGFTLTGAGHPHEFTVELPRGFLGDPAATSLRCSEVQLTAGECPGPSQIGLVDLTTGSPGGPIVATTPLYNMVPPRGSPGELATNVANVGIFAHVDTGVRSESDYGIEATLRNVIAFPGQPVFNLQTQLWGDPSAAAHDRIRGRCLEAIGTCPVEAQKTPLLSTPGDCPGHPALTEVSADSWEEPGLFHTSGYQSADLEGNPYSLSGCNELSYEPTISSQPTTNLADSPTGLDVDLHQPQQAPHTEPLSGRATAELKDARVTLPAGMVVNPSQADGLDACTEAQIGYLPEDEEEGVHFSKQPQSCPDAAKLGTVEVTSPLLAQYTEDGTKLATDSETGAPIPRPLQGSVYLAKPYANPFGSLLAIYLAIEDDQSGIVAKLGGRVESDPQTGQLTTVFEENPELPLEDVKLSFFNGDRAPLITPPTCATHITTSDLTPWSAPEGADAHPESSFQITAEPGGGACPSSEAGASNSPSFEAGTTSPQAGAFSPFVLKLHREDGSQRLTAIDTTLPPGLSGRLAGIPACSDAQIAQAVSREHPDEGILERNSPSCPASSELGSVDVAAGSGPTPFHTSGHAYLAGPYKGAPLSLAVIVPAVAGPFDLGAVVNRVALRLDPETAQIHAVSDPFPTIIEGIPLDLRSLTLEMGRPSFTLNPTSCEEMQILGSATSALGQIAPLTQRFQVGGCDQLPFKPKLSLTLKGKTKRTSHPTLIADLTAKPGEANIAKAQVKLPKAAFLDQGHIGTVCTRVQFAAKACPPGSVYGKVSATTPLLDYPLTGNVYLRSSTHQLPDLVADLNGPASQPVEIALAGKTDSVKGALRNTFEAVPDQPVTNFHLELFGGKRGLIILSAGLCKSPRAQVQLDGQNGKAYDTAPVVKNSCPKRHSGHKGQGRDRRGGGR